MKKTLISIALVFILMNLALTLSMEVAMADTDPCKDSSNGQFLVGPACELYKAGKNTTLPSFLTNQNKDAPGEYLLEGAGTATSPIYFALDVFRYFISGIAMIVVIIAAMRLIAENTPEQAEKARNSMVYGIVGLIMIQVADLVVKKLFFGEQGEAFSDPAMVEEFGTAASNEIRGIVGFMNIFVAAGAVLVIILRGIVILTSAGEEEAMTKAKKHIGYALFGLVASGLSELIVRGFIFPENGTKLPAIETGKKVLIMITNYLSGFIALGAFLTLVYAGYLYVVSAGKDEANENIKRLFLSAVIALILAAGAFAAVNTLVKLEQPKDTQETMNQIQETPTALTQ